MTPQEAAYQRNQRRWRSIAMARSFKELFAVQLLPRRWLYRWLLLADDGVTIRRVGEHVLADLRDYCFARGTTFHPDAITMARREGRRDVWLRISNYLNLDEAEVQKIMELDDGIG